VSEVPLSHNTVVCIEHFDNPELAPYLEEVWSPVEPRGRGWRIERADRKPWEVAMAVRALREHGAAHPAAEILGVGAGVEATVFVLTNHVRRVFATDLYLEPGEWEEFASTAMLADPGRFWTGPWRPRRLVAQHMDALDLRYEDASFDGIFSSSSVEHFGDHGDVVTAMREMHRVLRPGGVCSVSTEFRLDGPGPGLPGIHMFDRREIEELLIGAADWELVGGPLEVTPSRRTMDAVSSLEQAAEDRKAGRPYSAYPHLVLDHQAGPRTFTSIHLALRKPG
jgi:SAM-dependent methyltransferase